jgi:hypothetical protein
MKNGPILTAKEAKALIATAKTAKEHLKLSKYFSQQAEESHAAPGGVGTIEHCEFLAKSDRDMARALREMAAAHEEMAKEADK